MTDLLERALRERFTEAAAGLATPPDLGPVRERYRRRRVTRRAAVATAAAFAVVATALVVSRPDPAPVVAVRPAPVQISPTPVTALDPSVTVALAGHMFAMPVGFRVTQKPRTTNLLNAVEPPQLSTTAVAEGEDRRTATKTHPPSRVYLSYFEGFRQHAGVDPPSRTEEGMTTRPIEVGGHPGTLGILTWAAVERDCIPMPRHGTTPGIRCEGPFPKVWVSLPLPSGTALKAYAYGLSEQQVLDVLASGF